MWACSTTATCCGTPTFAGTENTFILVIITVPVSTGLALLVSLGLSSIEKLRSLFQTVYFLPYVTNTLAVGLVFMILFKKTAYTDGLVNVMLHWFGSPGVDLSMGRTGPRCSSCASTPCG